MAKDKPNQKEAQVNSTPEPTPAASPEVFAPVGGRRQFIFLISKTSLEVITASSAVYIVGSGFKSGSLSAGAK